MDSSKNTIHVYRVGKLILPTVDELSIEGRWNEEGIPCVYAASSVSHALIEASIHHNLKVLSYEASVFRYELCLSAVKDIPLNELPPYKSLLYTSSCQAFGSRLLRAREFLAFSIPSALIPSEKIYILNPLHPGMKEVRLELVTVIPATSSTIDRELHFLD